MVAPRPRTVLTTASALLALALFVCSPLLLAGHEHGVDAQCAVCSLATAAAVATNHAPAIGSALPEIGAVAAPDSEAHPEDLPRSNISRAPPAS